MSSTYITNWIKHTDLQINYWLDNYFITPADFSVTGIPGSPILHSSVLNHNLTSCCPSPNYPEISFEHFPEPYYGNPDDSKGKSAVVLFYNPGPQDPNQDISARGPNTFYDNFIVNSRSYYLLAKNLHFCLNTMTKFWNPKNNQLNNLLSFIPNNSIELSPLFMDIIPWHSRNFRGLLKTRYSLPDTLNEFKRNVIIPAVLNASNTLITRYVNSISTKKNTIVLFAIGALYSNKNYLTQIGFKNITNLIPNHIDHVTINNRIVAGNNSKITILHTTGSQLKSNIDGLNQLAEKDIYIINMWTPNIGMNIPISIQTTLSHIFRNI
jgi:hypothetical protein